MQEFIQSLLVLSAIIGIEAILSFDNAAVLAVIVNKNLPPEKRKKALQYGMIGAYVFRGALLFFVSWMLNNPEVGIVFKVIGGAYLVYLAYNGLKPKEEEEADAPPGWSQRLIAKLGIGAFWSTIIAVEFVDLVFSVDNLVAVVAMSKNMWIICIGVFIGIAMMRYVATQFSKLLVKYPSLEKSAYIVILLLGLKLTVGGVADYVGGALSTVLNNHSTELWFSAIMMGIFIIPIVLRKKQEPIQAPEAVVIVEEHEEHYVDTKLRRTSELY